MNQQPDQNDVSTALGLLRDSLSEEEQRIRNGIWEISDKGRKWLAKQSTGK